MRRKSLKKTYFAAALCLLLGSFVFCWNVFTTKIAIYGDSRTDGAAQRKIVQAILSFKPSVVFTVGDIVNDGNDLNQWKIFNNIAEPLLTTAEYFPSLGNHEKESSLYFDNFQFLSRRRWYSVEREGIHFVVLDSNSDLGPGSEQYRWLESDLGGVNTGINFKVALFHHPLFNVGGHKEDAKGLRAILVPLFKKHGVSAVFSGHDHNYQRFEYQGMFFIVTGGGGAPLYGQTRTSPYLKKFRKAYHFCLLFPGNGSLRVRVIGADSKIIDEFKIPR